LLTFVFKAVDNRFDMPTATSGVRLHVTLPVELADYYQEQADEANFVLEDFLAYRLTACRNHKAEKGIWFEDEARRELERLLGKNLKDATEALHRLRQILSVKVNESVVTLKPDILTRLKTRHLDRGKPFGTFVAEVVQDGIERYCGVR
jgi:hypothetical protein